ncbi:MAG: hypothetical protein IJ877_01595 [Candidatus Gastranaerophilales bacterium]|nr:hypothetical protein [Candidatus Gastranaerophilales bacterium]
MISEILGIGGVAVNGKAKLARSSNIEKTLFSNAKYTDTSVELPSLKEAQAHLAQFGEYAKGVKLDASHIYQYTNAHGAAQLFDKTAGESVVNAVIHLKHPLKTLFQYNIAGKLLKH